jgi:acetyltransferase
VTPEQLSSLSRRVDWDGEALQIRPVRPDDGPKLAEAVAASALEDVYFRFGTGMRRLPESLIRRLTEIDYDSHMALLAEDEAGRILGVSRLVCDPGCRTAEFALMVRSDRQKHGLGTLLFDAMADYARRRGVAEIWGDVARDNSKVRRLAGDLGFRFEPGSEPGRVKVVKTLADGRGGAAG